MKLGGAKNGGGSSRPTEGTSRTSCVEASKSITRRVRPSPFPALSLRSGGMLVSHLGVRGLYHTEDVEILAEEVSSALLDLTNPPREPIQMRLSATTQSQKMSGRGVIWTAMAGGLSGFVEDRAGMQRLVSLFRSAAAFAGPTTEVRQWLYLSQDYFDVLPNRDALVEMLAACASVEVRCPCATDGAVLSETKEKGGTYAYALLGEAVEFRSAEEEGQSAIVTVDPPPLVSPGVPAPRDGRICRLVLAASEAERVSGLHGERERSRGALFTEMLARDHPVLLLTGPERELRPMRWTTGGADVGGSNVNVEGGARKREAMMAMPVFFDRLSVKRTAHKTGVKMGGYGTAQFAMPKLAKHLLEKSLPAALCAFREANDPVYLLVGKAELQILAEGRVPTTNVGVKTGNDRYYGEEEEPSIRLV